MKLSVVVPVHDGGADLRACLAAIARSSRRADEIIVVDDGSRDSAVACATEFAARVVSLPGPAHGPAYARNRGAARASGDLLVFVDADVEIHADALERFARVFEEDAGVAAAFGSYDDQPPAPGTVSRFKNLLHHYVHQHGAREAETFWAGCGAIRREIFRALDGFCESYRRPSIEDIELGARLRTAGHRVRLCPEILCTHRKRWTLASLVRTDIVARAIPWTRLILRQGRLPSGLNTDARGRWSAVLAGLLVLGLLACALGILSAGRGYALAGAGTSLVALAMLWASNRGLYRCFVGHGGRRFALGAMGLFVLYLLYSGVVFVALLVAERLAGGTDGEAEGHDVPKEVRDRPSPLRKHFTGAVVFAVLFAAYVGNGDPLPGNDATPNVHLAAQLLSRGSLVYTPESDPALFHWTIVHDGTVQKKEFRSWDERFAGHSMRELYAQGALRTPQPSYYLSRTVRPGAFVSSYGPATGLFALPFVAAVYPFVPDLRERADRLWLLSKLAASFGVAASAWLLFLVAADRLRLATAVALTLVYGLGTCVWSVSSQALWQHAPGEFFLALGLLALFRTVEARPPALVDDARRGSASVSRRGFFAGGGYAPWLAGFAFGVAFLCRPTNSLAVMAGLVVLLGDRRALLRFVLGGLPVAALFFAYNLHFFDKWIAFGQVTALAERAPVAVDTQVLWQHSLGRGLVGVLLSPSRGLFVFSPVLLVSVWGAVTVWKQRRWLPLRAAALAALGICFVTARWTGWWGGWSFGYRLVVDAATLLAFLAIPVAEKIRARRGLVVLVSLLALWSVGVQGLGALVYDVTGWNNRQGYVTYGAQGKATGDHFPTSEQAAEFCRTRGCSYGAAHMNVDNGRFNDRLWSIGDSQILYYLQNLKRSRQSRTAMMFQFLRVDG
jgi:GT2 family glycosyltransferase